MKQANNDEYLQRLLEEGFPKPEIKMSFSDQKDFDTYKQLFAALQEEPEAGLSYQFSGKVSRTISMGKGRDFSFYWSVAMVTAWSMGTICLAMVLIDYQYHSRLFMLLWSYKWAFVLGLSCLLAIQHLDQKLVKRGT